ncbi:hypothetical protein BX591_15612, partial [Paraburkholderia bryophila]
MNDIDHRVLGHKLDLFHQQEEGAGMVFWHPRGWELYRVLEDYVRARMRRAGFREIRTPQLLARSLWEQAVWKPEEIAMRRMIADRRSAFGCLCGHQWD